MHIKVKVQLDIRKWTVVDFRLISRNKNHTKMFHANIRLQTCKVIQRLLAGLDCDKKKRMQCIKYIMSWLREVLNYRDAYMYVAQR